MELSKLKKAANVDNISDTNASDLKKTIKKKKNIIKDETELVRKNYLFSLNTELSDELDKICFAYRGQKLKRYQIIEHLLSTCLHKEYPKK